MLYNVFYNCYFHKHLVRFVPRWIRTEDAKIPRIFRTNESKPNPEASSVKKQVQARTVDCSEWKSNEKSSNKTQLPELSS